MANLRKRNDVFLQEPASRRGTMSLRKKQIRAAFRSGVFQRDGYRCAMCDKPGKDRQDEETHKKYHNGIPEDQLVMLDAHHITDRNEMPSGGFVPENGVSLCEACHERAESFHQLGVAYPGYAPEDLYAKIGSSYEKAYQASRSLGG